MTRNQSIIAHKNKHPTLLSSCLRAVIPKRYQESGECTSGSSQLRLKAGV